MRADFWEPLVNQTPLNEGIYPMSVDSDLRDNGCIMNVTTNSSLVSAFETSLGGFKKAAGTMDKAAQNIASGDVDPEQLVSLSQAEILAKANALAMRTADQLYGSMLNTVA